MLYATGFGTGNSLSHHATEAEAHTFIGYLEAAPGTDDHGVIEAGLFGRRAMQHQNETLPREFRIAITTYLGLECQLAAGAERE